MYQTSSKSQGFTIIELMITLAVAAILLSLAAPSFTDIIKNNRLVTQVNLIAAGLNFARSEAIKRNALITLCNSNVAQTACDVTWGNGWILFEENINGIIGTLEAGETIIRVGAGTAATGITLVSPSNFISYNPDGFINPNSLPGVSAYVTFKFCDDRNDASKAKGLVISMTGRMRTAIDSDSDGVIEDGGSNNVTCP